jgi:endoglucanase
MKQLRSTRAASELGATGIDQGEPRTQRRNRALALLFAMLAAVLVAVIVTAQQEGHAATLTTEAEGMTLSGAMVVVRTSAAASGTKELAFWSKASASTSFSGELTNLTLRARQDRCGFNSAKLRLWVDGIERGTLSISSSTYGNYNLPISGVGAGSHTLRLEFINDLATYSCDRNAYLDYVVLTTKDATTPPPTTPPPSAADNPFANETFYVNPNSNARRTAGQWRAQGLTQNAVQMEKIATSPDIFYFSEWTQNASGGTPAHVDWQTDQITSAGALPVYGLYAIPNRDCGAYSSGGFTTGDQYRSWVDQVVSGLQGREAVFVIEPDALASTNCLTSAQLTERFNLIHYAVNKIEAEGSAAYIDASNCFAPDSFIANRLISAGIADATGFARNVSNFCYTDSEIQHGTAISNAVGGKHFIIDTSRNGLGPYQGQNNWCNPPGRALGPKPTANTASPLVDAYYWLKRPGESDGSCNGYPSAGTWMPEYALGLAQRAAY